MGPSTNLNAVERRRNNVRYLGRQTSSLSLYRLLDIGLCKPSLVCGLSLSALYACLFIVWPSRVTACTRAGWRSGNTLESYSGSSRFVSKQGYTSMFPSMQLFIFPQLFRSLSQHGSSPIGYHHMLLSAKTVTCTNIHINIFSTIRVSL
jgi:hypothetical protein